MIFGKKYRAMRLPMAKGTKTVKFISAIASITNLYAPKDNNIALPEIPGTRKNEKAIKPIKTKIMKLLLVSRLGI